MIDAFSFLTAMNIIWTSVNNPDAYHCLLVFYGTVSDLDFGIIGKMS